MNDDIHAIHDPIQPVPIPDISDEHPQVRVSVHRKFLPQLELLELITAKNDEPFRLGHLQNLPDKTFTEGTGSSGDENCFTG